MKNTYHNLEVLEFLISRDGKTILEQPQAKENYNGTPTQRVEK